MRASTDPEMPRAQQTCLCWSVSEIGAVGLSYSPNVVDYFTNSFSGFTFFALVEDRVVTSNFPFGAFQVAQINFHDETNECRYFNSDFAPNAPPSIIRVLEVSELEAAMCKAEIDAQLEFLITNGIDVPCAGIFC